MLDLLLSPSMPRSTGQDPFTDVFSAWLYGRIPFSNVYHWLREWAQFGAPPNDLCRPAERVLAYCADVSNIAYSLAHLLGFLS